MVNIRIISALLLATLVLSGLWGGSCAADTLQSSDRFVRQLTAPMTIVIDGKPFRDTINQVATEAKINVWIDRRIDPSAPIRAGQLGPTVYAALKQIAAERDCVIMPIANVVLIGRATWVDATATSLLAIPVSLTRKTLAWDDLTTPTAAINVAVQSTPAEKTNIRLPHDLWPSAKLSGIQPTVGINLIYAQFDRKLRVPKITDSLESVPATATDVVPRRYGPSDELQTVLRDIVPAVKSKATRDAVVISATATVHRSITDAWLAKLAEAAVANQGEPTFDLKLVDVVAGAALQQFAQTAGLKCRIRAEAMNQCRTRVSLEVQGKKLREIMGMIAQQAGVLITQSETEVIVSLPAIEK